MHADAADQQDRGQPARPVRRRRRLGGALVAFGATGLVLIILAGSLVLASLTGLRDAAIGLGRQRAELSRMLEPAAASLRDAATATRHGGQSLTASAAAARDAATLTTQLATAFDQLGELSGIDVLGSRPFAGLGSSFPGAAEKARSLSTSLRATAEALSTDVRDSTTVADDFRRLADQLGELRRTIGPADVASPTADGAVVGAAVVILGLLAWLAMPAVASLWFGARWWRRGP